MLVVVWEGELQMNWKAVRCLGGREGGTTRNEIFKGGTRKASTLHGTGSLPHVPLGEQHSGYIPWREVPPTIVV